MTEKDNPETIDYICRCKHSEFDGDWHCTSSQALDEMKSGKFVDCFCIAAPWNPCPDYEAARQNSGRQAETAKGEKHE